MAIDAVCTDGYDFAPLSLRPGLKVIPRGGRLAQQPSRPQRESHARKHATRCRVFTFALRLPVTHAQSGRGRRRCVLQKRSDESRKGVGRLLRYVVAHAGQGVDLSMRKGVHPALQMPYAEGGVA